MSRSALTAVAVVLLAAAPLSALTINPTFNNTAGETWTANQIITVNAAIADFESVLVDSVSIDIDFDFVAAGTGGYLGQWSGGFSAALGADIFPWSPQVNHTIHLNKSLLGDLFFDPTPADAGGDIPVDQWDALSVVRHELGHALGFTDDFYVDNFATGSEVDKWTSNIIGGFFDPNGLNIEMADIDPNNLPLGKDFSHIIDSGATAGDLMVQFLLDEVRRPISQTDLSMLELAYGWTLADVSVLGDINGDGSVDVADLALVGAQWGTAGSPPNSADIAPPPNGDGVVDIGDLALVGSNWSGATGPSFIPGSAVPTPLTVSAGALLLLTTLSRRHRG